VYQQLPPPPRQSGPLLHLPAIMTKGQGKYYPVVELFGFRFRQLMEAA
jgi:hypothetical protein